MSEIKSVYQVLRGGGWEEVSKSMFETFARKFKRILYPEAAQEYQEMKTYCLGYTHDKCRSCLHDANWHALNKMSDSSRFELQKNMMRINSDKCRMTSMGEYASVEKYQEPERDNATR